MTINKASETNLAAWQAAIDLFAQVIDTQDTDNDKAADLVYLDF